ncbi:ARCN1 [Cordylochernes scorpioides]|uniref:Coatomer subunit delta n=1 Tax=Cordylochernes scorpioides TaxID=51811 RepID=A0ABY6K3S0_9ARAC|nr:ARCN1 [Cordylochernes scorpioides]
MNYYKLPLTQTYCAALVSRQFVEMTRARIEGLLAAFPKLVGGSGKQHTFVETESVRYVYQPLDKLYMLLITTRASNILEDLETLRLFSRIIPEYCKNMDEADIIDNSFNLIFAFDEIVALGYREQVNLAQIRTFVEMESEEEKVYQAVRMTQEREAKQKMREKAKELQRAKQEAARKGTRQYGTGGFGSSSGGFGSSGTAIIGDTTAISPTSPETPKPSYTAHKPTGTGKALKLGSKNKDVESFVDQLKSEGETVASVSNRQTSVTKSHTPQVNAERRLATLVCSASVHIRIEEKINLTALKDGGLQNLETIGLVTLQISEEKYGRIKIQMENNDEKGVQLQHTHRHVDLQTHPNIDKELFKTQQQIALKNPTKPFPMNADIGVLKWRFQTQDEGLIPLSINCWPTDNGIGGCDVNIEYELEAVDAEFNDVVISIPIIAGSQPPVVKDCDGEYSYEPRKNALEWKMPIIDESNRSGAMEFSASGRAADFFPVTVSFVSKQLFCNIKVVDVQMVDGDLSVKHSVDSVFYTEKYQVV